MSNTADIIKSGALEKLADIAHKLAGPMAEEIGLMMGDKVKVYRLKNWISVVSKTEKILKDAGLSPKSVPPRMLLPILEASSVENDPTLQDLWAGLLASGSDQADTLSPSFVETLKQLSPADARELDEMFQMASGTGNYLVAVYDEANPLQSTMPDEPDSRLAIETFERLGLFRRVYDLVPRQRDLMQDFYDQLPTSQSNLYVNVINAGIGTYASEKRKLPLLTYQLLFAEYGIRFMNACKGPIKSKNDAETERDVTP